MFVRARIDRLRAAAKKAEAAAKATAARRQDVEDSAKEVVAELEHGSVHRGFHKQLNKVDPDLNSDDGPDAYVDTLLALANAPMHGEKVASSSWGVGTPVSALPWIVTRRKRRDRFDALHSMRQRPFYMPTLSQMSSETAKEKGAAQSAVNTVIAEDVRKNIDRLEMLWKVSSSHGVSWDDLDGFYVEFHKNSVKAKKMLDKPSKDHPKESLVLENINDKLERYRHEQSELIRRKIHERLDRGISDEWNIYTFEKDGKRCEQEIELAVASRINKLAKSKRFAMMKKYRHLYGPGQLTKNMRDYVLHKMSQREAHERARGLATEKDVERIRKLAVSDEKRPH